MKPQGTRRITAAKMSGAYGGLLTGVVELLEQARRASARSINALMTATYWEIGRRIVEFEQGGTSRAEYGQQLLQRIAGDLTRRFGRGFGVDNLQRMRVFYQAWGPGQIHATVSRQSQPAEILQTLSGEFAPQKGQTGSGKLGLAKSAAMSPQYP